jgi:fatty acid-binding protein DegV
MRFGLVIDSPCDQAADFIAKHRIINLPVSIRIDGETLLDERSSG